MSRTCSAARLWGHRATYVYHGTARSGESQVIRTPSEVEEPDLLQSAQRPLCLRTRFAVWYRLPKDGQLTNSYTSLLPLHALHTTYLHTLLDLPTPFHLNAETIKSKLTKADLTGAHLVVKSAKTPSLIGLQGLVLEETAHTFAILGADDVVSSDTQVQLALYTCRCSASATRPRCRYGGREDGGGSAGRGLEV